MKKKPTIFVVLVLLAFFPNIPIVKSQFDLDVTVEAQKTAYVELANIKGNVSFQGELVENGLIGIQVNREATPIVMRTLQLNTNPSGTYSLEVTSLLPVDEKGNYKPSTERGKYIWIKMTIKNKSFAPRDVYLAITILDSQLTPLTVEMAIIAMPGNSNATFMPRAYIQKWANVGKAFICANAYYSWPKDGGRPYCPETVSNFNIEQSSSGSLPGAPVQNGTYGMSFRLRPDMMWGTCQVNVTAWSPSAGGYTGTSSTNFEYWLPGDFDHDNDVDLFDAVRLLVAYGSKEGDAAYNPICDIVAPYGVINLFDAVLMLKYYGVKTPRE